MKKHISVEVKKKDTEELLLELSLEKNQFHLLKVSTHIERDSIFKSLAGIDDNPSISTDFRVGNKSFQSFLPEERAKNGFFFIPERIPYFLGLKVVDYLRDLNGIHREDSSSLSLFREKVVGYFAKYGLGEEVLDQFVNFDMSLNERYFLEFVQIDLVDPKLVVFNEINPDIFRHYKEFHQDRTTLVLSSEDQDWSPFNPTITQVCF